MIPSVAVRVLSLSALMMASACASTSGTILKVKGDKEFEVFISPRDSFVKPGDKVVFFKSECDSPVGVARSDSRRCWDTRAGEGKVTQVTGDKATVKADGPVDVTNNAYVRWAYLP